MSWLWAVLWIAVGPGPRIDGDALARDIDRIVADHIAATKVPGVVVAVTDGDRIVLERGWGLADIDDQRPMDPQQTLVRIASISKTFTATAVAQLEDEGRLDIDADVDDYLTGVKTGGPFPEPVTVRHLLAHTSGFINSNSGRVSLDPIGPEDFEPFIARTMPPRMHPPGTATLYTNHGNALAGLVVQDIAGEPFAEYVRERIFAPLGMDSSRYYVDRHQPELARSYIVEDGEVRAQRYEYFGTVPASAVHTTAHDMARYLMLHAGDGTVEGTVVLSAAAMERMRTPAPTIHPALPEYHYAFAPTEILGRPARAHGGSVPAFLSRMVVFDRWGVGVFVAQNAFGPNVAGAVVEAVARQLPEAPPHRIAALGDGKPLDGAALVGEYRRLDKRETAAFTRPRAVLTSPALHVGLDGEGFLSIEGRRWIRTGDLVFHAHEDDGRVDTLVFVRDDDGAIAWVHENRSSAYRVAWYGRRSVQITAFALAFGLLVVGLLGARGRRVELGGVWAAIAAAALVGYLLPQIYALVVDADQPLYTQPLRLGIPTWIPALLWLPRLAAVGALGLLLRVRHRPAVLVTAGAVLLVALELYWRTPPPGLPDAG